MYGVLTGKLNVTGEEVSGFLSKVGEINKLTGWLSGTFLEAKYNPEINEILFTYSAKNGTQFTLNGASLSNVEKNAKNIIFSPYSEVANKAGIEGSVWFSADNADKLVLEGMGEGDLARMGITLSSEVEGEAAITQARAIFTKQLLSKVTSKLVLTLAGFLDVGLWAYTIVDIFWGNLIWHNDVIGGKSTSVSTVHLEPVTPAEAISWNAAHPDNKIAANTNMAPQISGTDNAYKSSLQQTQIFNFIKDDENKYDQHVGVKINLSAITTPWIRPDGAGKEDPYLGKVGGSDDNRGDAIIGMNIENISDVSALKDMKYELTIEDNAANGMTALAEDTRYSAPSYQLTTLMDRKSNKLIYAPNMNNSIVSARANSIRVADKFDGLVLNDNQDAELSVSIPNDAAVSKLRAKLRANGANGNADLYGGGYGVSFMSTAESGAASFMPVRSKSLRDKYLAQGESSPEFMYSAFNCAYPAKVGSSCKLSLSIGGFNDKQKHKGVLYLADDQSKTQTLPVYLRYHLVNQSNSATITEGDSSVSIEVTNVGGAGTYSKLQVSGLPEGAQLQSSEPSGCENGLAEQSSCRLTYDVSQVKVGSYPLVVYGSNDSAAKLRANQVPDATSSDADSFLLTVQPGF